jgi:excisionase family DNA binding protein
MPVNLLQATPAAELPDQPTPWLTAAEAAARARCGPATIYAAARSGALRAARISGRRSYRFLAEWVDDWLRSTAPIEVTRAPAWRVAR